MKYEKYVVKSKELKYLMALWNGHFETFTGAPSTVTSKGLSNWDGYSGTTGADEALRVSGIFECWYWF